MKNLLSVTGRLTNDCEMKYFESGKIKTTFTIAVDSFINKEKSTSFIRCEVWDKQAEFAGEYFKRGNVVTAYGELTSNDYKDKTYYTLNCRKIGYTSSQMIVKGIITSVFSKKMTIQLEEKMIEVDFFGKEPPQGEHTIVLNYALKDYKPVYTYIEVIE